MSEDEFAFAEPLRLTPPGAFERAYMWSRRGPYARLKEFALFMVPGVLIVATAYELRVHDWLNAPLALLLGFCGVLCAGFGFLPPVQRPQPPAVNPKSKRAQR